MGFKEIVEHLSIIGLKTSLAGEINFDEDPNISDKDFKVKIVEMYKEFGTNKKTKCRDKVMNKLFQDLVTNMTNQCVKILNLCLAFNFDEFPDFNRNVRNSLLFKKFEILSLGDKEICIERIQIVEEFADKQSIQVSSHKRKSIKKIFYDVSILKHIFVKEILKEKKHSSDNIKDFEKIVQKNKMPVNGLI